MPAKPAIHTIKQGSNWINVREGSTRRIGDAYGTKAQAQAAGRERARRDKTEHIVHNTDGKIGSRNSYGNDPRGRKG